MNCYGEYMDSETDWIGEVPVEWNRQKIKYLYRIIGGNGFPEVFQGEKEGKLPFLKVSDINGTNREVAVAANYVSQIQANDNKWNRIPPGSILMAKIGAALLKNHRKINTCECLIDNNMQALVLIGDMDPVYSFYYWNIIDMAWYDNGGTIPSINNQKLLKQHIFIPEKIIQQAIAAYLDRKTASIDALIMDKQRLIELLNQQRSTVISRAVTMGLDPTAPMKDSGAEWIGEIPTHWKMVPAKALFSQSNKTMQKGDVKLTSSQKHGIISQADYIELEKQRVVLADKGNENWKHVEPNDFIISLRSFQGGLELSYISGCITWHYVVLQPKDGVEPEFFKWLFKSSSYIAALQRTANFIRDGQDLRFTNFIQVPLPLIPRSEQVSIAKYINSQVELIDALVADISEQIGKLKEYRQSIIYEVVTGKVAV